MSLVFYSSEFSLFQSYNFSSILLVATYSIIEVATYINGTGNGNDNCNGNSDDNDKFITMCNGNGNGHIHGNDYT
jgi:hypothetical protein